MGGGGIILESLEYLSEQNASAAAATDGIWQSNNKVYQMFTNIDARVSNQIKIKMIRINFNKM